MMHVKTWPSTYSFLFCTLLLLLDLFEVYFLLTFFLLPSVSVDQY